MNTNFKAIGLTRLGIKPKTTVPEEDALTTRPSEIITTVQLQQNDLRYGKLVKEEELKQ